MSESPLRQRDRAATSPARTPSPLTMAAELRAPDGAPVVWMPSGRSPGLFSDVAKQTRRQYVERNKDRGSQSPRSISSRRRSVGTGARSASPSRPALSPQQRRGIVDKRLGPARTVQEWELIHGMGHAVRGRDYGSLRFVRRRLGQALGRARTSPRRRNRGPTASPSPRWQVRGTSLVQVERESGVSRLVERRLVFGAERGTDGAVLRPTFADWTEDEGGAGGCGPANSERDALLRSLWNHPLYARSASVATPAVVADMTSVILDTLSRHFLAWHHLARRQFQQRLHLQRWQLATTVTFTQRKFAHARSAKKAHFEAWHSAVKRLRKPSEQTLAMRMRAGASRVVEVQARSTRAVYWRRWKHSVQRNEVAKRIVVAWHRRVQQQQEVQRGALVKLSALVSRVCRTNDLRTAWRQWTAMAKRCAARKGLLRPAVRSWRASVSRQHSAARQMLQALARAAQSKRQRQGALERVVVVARTRALCQCWFQWQQYTSTQRNIEAQRAKKLQSIVSRWYVNSSSPQKSDGSLPVGANAQWRAVTHGMVQSSGRDIRAQKLEKILSRWYLKSATP